MKTYWIVPAEKGERGDAGGENGLPPAIKPEEWPRHPASGLPLVHAFTVRVPEAYRARGAERAALSYFHSGRSEDDPPLDERGREILDGAELTDAERALSFYHALAAHHAAAHPATIHYRDSLNHSAIVWHTEAELNAPRCPRPEPPLPYRIRDERALRFAEEEPPERFIQFGPPLHLDDTTSEAELREQGFGDCVLEIHTRVGGANFGFGD